MCNNCGYIYSRYAPRIDQHLAGRTTASVILTDVSCVSALVARITVRKLWVGVSTKRNVNGPLGPVTRNTIRHPVFRKSSTLVHAPMTQSRKYQDDLSHVLS
ncbi:rubredoxin [Caudoviricetes sp.]|nr:rubredoxin [Caudoviricetes sp.]